MEQQKIGLLPKEIVVKALTKAGYVIKDGQTDFKPCAYEGARQIQMALLALIFEGVEISEEEMTKRIEAAVHDMAPEIVEYMDPNSDARETLMDEYEEHKAKVQG